MKKMMKLGAFALLAISVALSGSLAFAQSQEGSKGEKTSPAGWSQGEKKGWHGSDTPPGLAKKEAKEEKSEMSEAEKEAKKAEKEKKKAEKKAEKKAKKEKEELDKQTEQKVKKDKKEAEEQKAVEKQKKHPKFWPFGKKK